MSESFKERLERYKDDPDYLREKLAIAIAEVEARDKEIEHYRALIAFAPHAPGCASLRFVVDNAWAPCDCWKAGGKDV